MAQRYSALAQGKSGKGADADGKNHNHIHPEALHLAKRPTAGASGDNPGDSAPAVDSERCQTLCYLGVAPPLVLSADWLLEHDTWATRLFRFPPSSFWPLQRWRPRSHRSHTGVCSRRLAALPPCYSQNDFGGPLPVSGRCGVGTLLPHKYNYLRSSQPETSGENDSQ